MVEAKLTPAYSDHLHITSYYTLWWVSYLQTLVEIKARQHHQQKVIHQAQSKKC